MAPTCAMARARLAQATYKLLPSSLPEKVVSTVKGLNLTTFTGAERHIGGVALLQGWKGVVMQAPEVAADYLRSLATGTPRQRSLVMGPRAISEYAGGFRQGLLDAAAAVKNGVDPEIMGNTFDLTKGNADAPGLLGTGLRYVRTFVSARNKPFFEAGMRVNLLEQAQVLANREGLSGGAWADRVNQLLKNPTDEMAANALRITNESVLADESVLAKGQRAASNYLENRIKGEAPIPFPERVRRYVITQGYSGDEVHNQVTKLMATKTVRQLNDMIGPRTEGGTAASMAGGMRATAGLGYAALNLTSQFPRIGENIAKFGIDYSPLGLVRTAVDAAWPTAVDRPGIITRGLTKAAVGTAAGMGVGYYLASKGIMGTDVGDTPAQKAMNRLEGKPTGTWVRVGGDYHQFSDAAAPVSMMPMMGVLLWKQRQEEPAENPGVSLLKSQGQYLGQVAKHSLAASLGGLGSGLTGNDQGAAQQLIGQALPVPPVVGQAARAIDRQPRDTRDANPFVGALKQAQSKIPFLSEQLPAQTNALGVVPPRGTSATANALQQFFDPSRPSVDQTQGDTDRARVLREANRVGVMIAEPPKSFKIGRTTVQRTPEEQRAFEAETGPAVIKAAIEMMDSPAYQQYQDRPKVQAMMLHAAILGARREAVGLDKIQRFQQSPESFTQSPP